MLIAASLGSAAAASAATVRWLTHPAVAASDTKKPVVLQFRREIALKAVPRRAVVNVSADNRYILYVNGARVATGPARGDLANWRYRAVDLRSNLRAGRNVIAALVWNDGSFAGFSQISARTGFALWSDVPELSGIDTGSGWLSRIDASRTTTSAVSQIAEQLGPGPYYAASPPETHNAAARRADWLAPSSASSDWVPAVSALTPGQSVPWTLVEDRLPAMAYDRLPAGRLVRSEGVRVTRFPAAPVEIPANTTAALLIDAGRVQAAYPELIVSGGAGAEIWLTYSEALYGPDKRYLRDRSQVEAGQALGLTDTFQPDGSQRSLFQPFWWRVWRYAQLRVKTGAAPLRLESFQRYATGYPFPQRGSFVSSDPQLDRIWSIGWDTVKLDAHETFMDTAYWEQLQYIGDTRLEALATYAVSGDPRLAEQALDAFRNSMVDGIPQSRWPSREVQSIPPFALLWVGMLHDFWWHQPDKAPVRRNLDGVRSVLDWYHRYLGKDGLVGTTPGWEFIDWRPHLSNIPWGKDPPPKSDTCITTLLYIGALEQAADLEEAIGDPARSVADRAAAGELSRAVQAQCWDAGRGLYADTPAKAAFSQHANALAVLYDVAPKAQQIRIMDRITVRGSGIDPPAGIAGTTYYFSFYLARALEHAGLADRYLELMPTWRRMLGQNFTTWPEEPDPTRSDSHAWSAHPTSDLLQVVAGIGPGSPGYATVRIAPHLGILTRLDAAAMTPHGRVSVSYRLTAGHLHAAITTPAGLSGLLEWNGQQHEIRPGTTRFNLARNGPASSNYNR